MGHMVRTGGGWGCGLWRRTFWHSLEGVSVQHPAPQTWHLELLKPVRISQVDASSKSRGFKILLWGVFFPHTNFWGSVAPELLHLMQVVLESPDGRPLVPWSILLQNRSLTSCDTAISRRSCSLGAILNSEQITSTSCSLCDSGALPHDIPHRHHLDWQAITSGFIPGFSFCMPIFYPGSLILCSDAQPCFPTHCLIDSDLRWCMCNISHTSVNPIWYECFRRGPNSAACLFLSSSGCLWTRRSKQTETRLDFPEP